ncbi:MAG: hypothetical protein HZB46_01940, partial [Solirubrobacterales bacterium]|nr:hypothetical protein [Solirubrobacterales bacterium]
MPLRLVTGPANAAKARVVLGAYREALGGEPILVVPTFPDVGRYRRELAAGGLVFGVDVVHFPARSGGGFARVLARRAGVGGQTLGTIARERLAAAAVAATRLERLAASARTPGFPRALLRLVDELEESRVDPPRFTRALRDWAGDDGARRAYGDEVSALYAAYRRLLEETGLTDVALRTRAALDALRLEPARWGGTPVFLYGFDDLLPVQRDAIETLAVHCGADVMVSLTFEPGRTAFADRAGTYQDLLALGAEEVRCPAVAEHYAPAARATLHRLERTLFDEEEEAAPGPPDPAVLSLEAGGDGAEAELVAAHVARLLRDGFAPEDVAIVHRTPADVAPLLEQVLRDYGIPHAMERRMPAGHTALGRGLLALLRCAVLEGAADDLLTWLRTPGVLERPALADRLEARVRTEGLRTAAEARRAWEAEHWPLGALDRVAAAARDGMRPLCDRLAAEVQLLLAAPWRRRAPVLRGHEAVDARVAARLRSALRELGGLRPPLEPTAAEVERTLADLEVRLGEPPGPGRVTVARPLDLRARR